MIDSFFHTLDYLVQEQRGIDHEYNLVRAENL